MKSLEDIARECGMQNLGSDPDLNCDIVLFALREAVQLEREKHNLSLSPYLQHHDKCTKWVKRAGGYWVSADRECSCGLLKEMKGDSNAKE